MAKKTEAIDWGKLLADLQALKATGVAVAEAVVKMVQDLLNRQKATAQLRSAKPVKCDPGCFDCTKEYLEKQRESLCDAMCANLCVSYDIEQCCPCDDGDGPTPF